jgi:Carboxypeptidase regulatory-like domain
MLNRKMILICLLTLIPLASSRLSSAQAVANAQIHGTVQDATGAVVIGAQVKATQKDTGYTQTAVSDSNGGYSLLNLPVGGYKIEVSAPGFKSYTRSGIVLQVANNVMINVPLQVGDVSQRVEVSGDAAMVQTEDTSISQVIDQRRIVDLPLNGRQATDLIALSGGAASPPNAASRDVTSHDYVNSLAISVSGGQINGNNYLLDGADNNDSHSNINLPFPFPDALQEFSVQTNGISARYGLHPGSVVNVVTKSGTNSFHGDLFEFIRNGAFNARNFFATKQDNLRRNQYGGTIGGPIRRNKIFAFGGFQETKNRTAPPNTIAYVATQAALNGDFSTLESAACQSNGVAKQIVNPTTKAPYANNYINPTNFVAPALNLLKLIPISTDPCGKLVYAISNPSNEYQYVSRLDWVLSSKNSVFARYFILDYANPAIYTNNLLTTARPALLQRDQTIALGDQYTITPTLINSVHIDFSRLAVNRSNPSNMPTPVGLGVNMYNAAPNYIQLTVSNYFTVGGGSNATSTFIRNQWQYADDMDWIRGRHHFSFGGEFIANQMDETNLQYANGYFNFNGAATNSGLADYLLGSVYQLTDSGLVVIGLREKYYGAYFQDDIQLTKRLNVHAGVRWEPSVPEHDAAGRGNHFSLPAFTAGTKTTVYQNAPPGLLFHGDPGIPSAYANGSWDDFAPRVGFAWDPTGTGEESVRASYGIFFDQPESYTDRDFALASPWGNQITLTSPAGGLVNPYAAYPGGNPFPFAYPPSKTSVFPTGASYINLPLNLHHPYMQQWGLSLERQLEGDWFVTANYIGNKATHFRSSTEENPAIYIPGNSTTGNTAQRRTLSQLNPAAGAYYSTITLMDDGVNTSYNALKLTAQHRLSQKYTVLASYTYSHCLQDTETLGNRVTGNNESNPYNRNADYGACDYDLRHNFVGSFLYQGFSFANRKLNLIAGGWAPSFLVSYNNGFPFSPRTGTDASLSGVGLDRPDAVAGVSPYLKNKSKLLWINPAAFVKNAPGTFGTVRMNSLLGPRYVDSDLSLVKLFNIHEQQQFQLRFEFFNVFNHTNFDFPVSTFNSASFGKIQSSEPARILQFAAKYTF